MLRHSTLHVNGDRYQQVHAAAHVLAVFEHRGRKMATVAEWLPGAKRWSYETIARLQAEREYWPDGQPPPAEHDRCDACTPPRPVACRPSR